MTAEPQHAQRSAAHSQQVHAETQAGLKTKPASGEHFFESPRTAQLLAMQAMIDASPRTVQLRRLAEMVAQSPRALQLKAQIEAIEHSPREVAQRAQIAALFGHAPVQRVEEEEPTQGKLVTQRVGLEEEEPIQSKFASPVQRVEEEEPKQGKFQGGTTAQLEAEPAPNRTGMPDALKAGVESLSGMSLDHVKVHYNSDKPAQLSALAYAQGSEIHVAPGQEQHLPHEAWHVVQQAQGRVQPTVQMAGVAVNDDGGLEHEADVMGARAAGCVRDEAGPGGTEKPLCFSSSPPRLEVLQGMFWERTPANEYVWHWGPVVNRWWQPTGDDHDGYGVFLRRSALDGERESDQRDQESQSESESRGGGGINYTALFLLSLVASAGILPQAQGAYVARRPLRPFALPDEMPQNIGGLLNMTMPMITHGDQPPFSIPPGLDLDMKIPQHLLDQVSEMGKPDDLDHPEGLGVFHEHIFFNNGTNIGFFDDGIHSDQADMLHRYLEPVARDLDEDQLNTAITRVRLLEPFRSEDYLLTGSNCQTFVRAVLAEYATLSDDGELRPSWTDSFVDFVVALDSTFYGYLDAEVQAAVDEKLVGVRRDMMKRLGDNPYAPLLLLSAPPDLESTLRTLVRQVAENEAPEKLKGGTAYEAVLKFGRKDIQEKVYEKVSDPKVRRRLVEIIARKVADYILGLAEAYLNPAKEPDAFVGQVPRGGTRTDTDL